jgi:MOB kinase activator 1
MSDYTQQSTALAIILTYGIRFEYLWQDSENYKRPTKMPAPVYIEHLMTWVQSKIDNEQDLPSKIGKSGYRLATSRVRKLTL